ncbi:MAG TPA: hypothetical protein VIE68_05225 [Gemmatimonadota bacterium]
MTRSAVLATLLLVTLAPAAHSQTSYRSILEAQLTAVGNTVSRNGYRPDSGVFHTDMIVGLLPAGGDIGLEVDLVAGVEYMIVGVCDGDCSDLDLSLSDVAGNELFSDDLEDDAPILSFTAPGSGAHILWVTMYACSVEPCSFGYKVYRR